MSAFGKKIRETRKRRLELNDAYSVRKTAGRIGIEPSYLSKIERGEQPPPSERTVALLAGELELDPDKLLALAGKIAGDVKSAVIRRPESMPAIVRKLAKKTKTELSAFLKINQI
jgi:transcriptional regulator with XRE-family HTH domain